MTSGSSALDDIRDLFAYNRWAYTRMFDRCQALSDEEYTRDLRSSFSSVRDTLAHAIGAEWLWLQRWNGTSPAGFPDTWDVSSPATLRAHWMDMVRDQQAFLDELGDGRLQAVVHYRNVSGVAYAAPLGQLMRHVVNHASYHRGQITTMLRQLGYTAVSTDLVQYHREQQGAPTT